MLQPKNLDKKCISGSQVVCKHIREATALHHAQTDKFSVKVVVNLLTQETLAHVNSLSLCIYDTSNWLKISCAVFRLASHLI